MKAQPGFSLIELLIALSILGILGALAGLTILNATKASSERAALGHGHNVFKAAWAYVAEAPGRALVTGDCAAGYTAGSYSVPNPGGSVRSCTVRDRGDGTPEVEVVSQSGRTHRLP
ncbi:type II secretion system protein [Thermus sp.]|uniref:type II secretion system protein n=1 Tax=Thermus sp. TaxID=275 RepID=UPI002617D1C4|nr:type II secretion system protein [Thermus sp.]MCX7851018.1 type II secretion system GspH family protein [Thermus sp.]